MQHESLFSITPANVFTDLLPPAYLEKLKHNASPCYRIVLKKMRDSEINVEDVLIVGQRLFALATKFYGETHVLIDQDKVRGVENLGKAYDPSELTREELTEIIAESDLLTVTMTPCTPPPALTLSVASLTIHKRSMAIYVQEGRTRDTNDRSLFMATIVTTLVDDDIRARFLISTGEHQDHERE